MHSTVDQEIQASDSEEDIIKKIEAAPFLVSESTSSTIEGNTGLYATGGSFSPTLATTQGSAFLPYTGPETFATKPQTGRVEIVNYTVKSGDTASGIAQSFGITVETLLWSNELSSINRIKPGDELTILPVNGVLYEVKRGDTLASIAKKYKSDVDKILRFNDIESASHIFEGQTIIIPDGVKPAPVPTRGLVRSAPRYASRLQNLDSYFIRPATGGISQWLHGNNGIDIAGGCWQPVYSAAAGTVGIAVGNGRWNGGFGNYVTIQHSNGLRTLYAHFIQTVAAPGQQVAQGQLIGYTGSTGRSSGCHLHWEVHGARNPLAY